MNIGRMKLAGVLGILSGILFIIIGFRLYNVSVDSRYMYIGLIIYGIIMLWINISIAVDASKRRKNGR